MIVIFLFSTIPLKVIEYTLKIIINGKRLFTSKFVKYFGVLIDSLLKWDYRVYSIAPKRIRALAILSKLRYLVDAIL